MVCTPPRSPYKGVLGTSVRATAQKAAVLLEPKVLNLEPLRKCTAPAMRLWYLLLATAIWASWNSRMGSPER